VKREPEPWREGKRKKIDRNEGRKKKGEKEETMVELRLCRTHIEQTG
jgi:hypothetical protein